MHEKNTKLWAASEGNGEALPRHHHPLGRRPFRVMNKKLNQSELVAVLEYVREMIAGAAIDPDLRGQALVDSIPADERKLIDERFISAYLKLEATT